MSLRGRFLAALVLLSVGARASAAPAAVYDEKADAPSEVAAAVARAGKEGRRVLVDFGGNWCGDCLALDRNFRLPENAAAIAASFVLVHVDIGRFDKNVALAEGYGVPLKKGVPALVVLDGKGKVLYAQKNGEFEDMRSMDPVAVNAFLRKWRPAPVSRG